MKSKLLLIPLVVLIALALLSACGGGDDSDNDSDANGEGSPAASGDVAQEEAEFYRDAAEVITTSNAAIAGAIEVRTSAFEAATAAGRETLLAEFAEANLTAVTNRAEAVAELDPPSTLQRSHDLLLSAANDAIGLAEEIAAAIEADPPETEADYADLAFALDAATVTSRFRDACGRLQLEAGGAVAEVDLGCSP